VYTVHVYVSFVAGSRAKAVAIRCGYIILQHNLQKQYNFNHWSQSNTYKGKLNTMSSIITTVRSNQ